MRKGLIRHLQNIWLGSGSLAWLAAITALPSVIQGIDEIVTEIGKLSSKFLTPKADLQRQKNALSANLMKLMTSLQKIGISIRDYADIYAATIQEETTANELLYRFSLWQADKMKENSDAIFDGFKELKNIDAQVGQLLSRNEKEIENDDFRNITNARSQFQQLFFNAQTDLNKYTTDSWNSACNSIDLIHTQTGNINSTLVARFKTISTALIDSESLKTRPNQ
jgi:hypothetical protein